MPTPTEGREAATDDVLHLDRETTGKWAPGPNAHFRLISDAVGKGKGFSRAAMHRHLLAHHEAIHGGDTHATSEEFENAGRGTAQTVFHKRLPGEVKRYLEGNPAARHLFRVTQDAAQAGGEDALHDLGEHKYFAHADRLHGSTLNAALETARHSDDPEMRFTAMIHDHLPDAAERKNLDSVPAGKLKTGQRFTYGGHDFRVTEDADGYKVLAGLGEEIPLDALKTVPVDRGSLRKAKATKAQADDIAPFSAADADTDAPGTLWLHASATPQAGKPGKTHMGQPVMDAWADALICGNYTHPVTGQQFSIDRARLDRCVSTFHSLKANGFEPPCVDDHKETAGTSNGFLIDAKRDGDRLMLLHRFIGDDAIRKASRNRVSVKLVSAFKDSRGKVYRDAITHSALTPCPVIPGQTGFSVAASRSAAAAIHADVSSAPVFILAAPTTSHTRTPDMPLSSEQIDRVRKLPGAADVTEEGAADFLLSYAEAAGNHLVTLADEKEVFLSQAAAAADKLEQALELSRATPADPYARLDPEALADRADLTLSRIDLAIERGDMPKAIADKIKGKVKVADKPNAMLLSRSEHLDARPIDFILSLFDGGKLGVRTGEVTGTQLLSRATPGEHVELSGAGAPAGDHNPLLDTAKAMTGKK